MASDVQPSVTPSSRPRLLDRVRQEIRVRHMALSTERLYVNWIRRFILFHQKRHPAEMSKEEVSKFLTHAEAITVLALLADRVFPAATAGRSSRAAPGNPPRTSARRIEGKNTLGLLRESEWAALLVGTSCSASHRRLLPASTV